MDERPIRRAASAVCVRPAPTGFEVLVVQRSSASRFLPGYVAFPGGAVDAEDEARAARWFKDAAHAPRAAAVRELAEEVALALTADGLVASADLGPSDGEMATAPAMTARGHGDVRMFYFQTAGGGNIDEWNVWYRASSDGGRTWSRAAKISDASGGASYKTAAGFGEPYGDYGEMGITSQGNAIAGWGEGTSYTGPGGVWVNRQT